MAISGITTSNYVRSTTSPLTPTGPLSFSCWFYTDSVSGIKRLVESKRAAAGVGRDTFMMQLNGTGVILITGSASDNSGNTGTLTTIAVNTWYHAVGVWAANLDRTSYINGAQEGTATAGSWVPASINCIQVGHDYSNGTISRNLTGRICEVAVWKSALTLNDAKALYAGVSPLRVKPEGLYCYYPLETPERRMNLARNDYGLTLTGSLSTAIHPRVIKPSRKDVQRYAA